MVPRRRRSPLRHDESHWFHQLGEASTWDADPVMSAERETAEWDESQLKPITDRLSVEEKVALVQVAQFAEMFGRHTLGYDSQDPLYLRLHEHLRTLGMRPTGATAKISVPWVFHTERGR